MRVAAIVPAAGKGLRFKTRRPKAFSMLEGKPLLAHTLSRLARAYPFSEIIVAVSADARQEAERLIAGHRIPRARVVAGGSTRAESVLRALEAVSPASEWVLVHDAARPLVSKRLVSRLLGEVKKTGAAIAALPVTSTVKRANADLTIRSTEDRSRLYLAQTPQVFKKRLLFERYQAMGAEAFKATDEAALFDGSRVRVLLVEGEARNLKITVPEDAGLFKFYLKAER